MKDSKFVINKSRYDSIDSYLSNDPTYKAKYDDIDLVYDKDIYQKLRDSGVDDKLAKHVAHLFIRDPLVIFKELLDLDDSQSSDHFEVSLVIVFSLNHSVDQHAEPLPPESSVHKLANHAFQASTTQLLHRMAC